MTGKRVAVLTYVGRLVKLCLDCIHLEKPCNVREFLSFIGFFDKNNICKFFEGAEGW